MSKPDFHAIYPDPLEAECCEGYYDGRRPDSPEPGPNRHPAYIHGFMNGRDDIGVRHGKTAQERRETWRIIVAMLSDPQNTA